MKVQQFTLAPVEIMRHGGSLPKAWKAFWCLKNLLFQLSSMKHFFNKIASATYGVPVVDEALC